MLPLSSNLLEKNKACRQWVCYINNLYHSSKTSAILTDQSAEISAVLSHKIHSLNSCRGRKLELVTETTDSSIYAVEMIHRYNQLEHTDTIYIQNVVYSGLYGRRISKIMNAIQCCQGTSQLQSVA